MMKKTINWDKVERVALYSSVVMFIVAQSLSMVAPAIEDLLPQQSPMILLATALLIGIHHLIKLIEATKEVGGFVIHRTFTNAFNQLCSSETHISTLSIAAYTSSTWFEHVRLCDFTIDTVRLLLFYDEDFLTKNVDEDPSASRFRIEQMTARWKRLVDDKKIRILEIRHIDMFPPIYFGLVNREKGIFGYLWPRRGISGLEPRNAVFLYANSEHSTAMLTHTKQWFDAMWEIANKVPSVGTEGEGGRGR